MVLLQDMQKGIHLRNRPGNTLLVGPRLAPFQQRHQPWKPLASLAPRSS